MLPVVVKYHNEIKEAVKDGQRPDLSAITGPEENLVKLTRSWISHCWRQSPDDRPAFFGIYCMNFRKFDKKI